ncbi:replication-relaxation family protein [Streptomyces mirabilis]|uniref:Replication-relaxation family protein n=1 Tax=Streptomyces mirabilis TaxID=68239 RepID=A0ABU3V4V6_9ACTN|nr:replication-relaxation family protein [Streptomyces mirabilis]MCX5355560.1 replication-relaxation family protein [Streptomyces mirabilis]MDU9001206.1 replication-relaxation family protein [Streptomyces mirabilis]
MSSTLAIARMPRAGLPRLAQQALPLLYQHRLMATSQLHQLLTPHTRRPVYLLRQLGLLRTLQLVDATSHRNGRMGRGEQLWFITPRGAEVVERAGEVTARAYRMSPEAAVSQLQDHTLAVVDTGVAFTRWARVLGDECGPLDWEPELAHRVRDGAGDDAFLIPDAVLRYTRTTEDDRRRLLTYFVEVDRATMHVSRLGKKLTAYARYASYVPQPPPGRPAGSGSGREAWRDRYPAFPRLLVVFAGVSPIELQDRVSDLRALAAADARLRRTTALTAGVTTLELLRAQGPLGPIVTPILGAPEPTDILLAPPGDRSTA